MITSEQVRAVLDHTVCDSDGNKIGSAKHVFLDDVTGAPEWVSVKTGLFGANESFVPIREATMVGDHLEVPYDKETVRKAPNVDVDSGGHLSESEEHRLCDYYGINWDAAWQQANQPGGKGWAAGDTATGAVAGTAAGAAVGTAADRSATTPAGPAAGAATGASAGAGTRTGAAAGAAGSDSTGKQAMSPADRETAADEPYMIRSEERMHVSTERRASGRARLRKYVVTEQEEQTVPLRHEEVRLEHEPITEANRGAAASGITLSEDERELTLYAERPVTEIETVPVERVRMTTEEVTEQETVRGEVRKERIEAETEIDKDPGAPPRP
jgi:uncharacterized protein (TIGR02271 family)